MTTRRPIAVAFFTNEEGARFQPDMMGSLVYVGGIGLNEAYAAADKDGASVGDELRRIGYLGPAKPGALKPHAFVELHIEQGPILDEEKVQIGVVESVQGISWTEYTVTGVSNHAGTTPMRLRRDAGYLAASVNLFVRKLAWGDGRRSGGHGGLAGAAAQPHQRRAQSRGLLGRPAQHRRGEAQGSRGARRRAHRRSRHGRAGRGRGQGAGALRAGDLRRPSWSIGSSTTPGRCRSATRRMPSGAGHDAQMMQRLCPTAMIFVPSVAGLSHNVKEHTEAADLAAGAQVLLNVMLELAEK